MQSRVTLEAVSGPMTGQVFQFDEHDTFLVGRAADCHARLPSGDPTASRHHFILEVNPPAARIRDLGSLNGTYVNGAKHAGRRDDEHAEHIAALRFPAVDLHDGDRIEVGETRFAVRIELPTVRFDPVRCPNCCRDVTAELPPGAHGDYICEMCRDTMTGDPSTILKDARAAGTPAGLVAPKESIPAAIGRYQIVDLIGRGNMGAVYRGREVVSRTTVALKVMLARTAVDEQARQVFLREITILRALRHPNLIELLDHGSFGSAFYFVMEMCEGGDLEQLSARRGGRLTPAEAVPLMLQAVEGLAFAHAQGFVHRDLKPSNILVAEPDGRVAKVADFGLAKSFEKAGLSGMTATGAVSGTLLFMPREQITNFKRVQPVSDVWSVGATLYALLTGATPREFPAGTDPIQVILQAPIVPIRERDAAIPAALAGVIDRAVAVDTADRYQTAAEFRDALVAV